MPPTARTAVTSQAQGIPLFAVETVRSLIDRDVVQPVEGVYRLTGDVGELAVPDSLHALLAARLDALDPGVRRLVSDAAVLGTTFPAEALIAVSGRDEPVVRAALADLVRREVLSVSADPLSPERGSYRFAQQMLRQVAYDTLSRRDRKTRHLKVAAHLRAVFAGDGEEMADVIARHYLDALNAVPDDPDAAEIRGQAIAALIRAGERAERTGASARGAASYAAAADLVTASGPAQEPAAGTLWERAATAATADADFAVAIDYAGRARTDYLQRGHERAAARTQAVAGRALRRWGRHTEARDQLTAAMEVLRADPDTDTVLAMEELAVVAVFAGSGDADRLTTEVLVLGQALDVSAEQLSGLLLSRGIYLGTASRRSQAIAYFRESARLAAQTDNVVLGTALLNLSDVLAVTDPAAAAEAARTAAGHLRRVGLRIHLVYAITNLAEALVQLGDWDAADAEFAQAVNSYGLADMEPLTCQRGWLAALRGDADSAETMLAALTDLRATEDPQDQSMVSLAEAFTAAARGQRETALNGARAALAHADVMSISSESLRWAWPLAARMAHELGDNAAVGDLIALLDSHQPGHLAPMLRAERDLARARLAETNGDADQAAAVFAAAIDGLHERSTPFHLAHGLLDHAEYLIRHADPAAASLAVEEARDIGRRLRCQPVADRADALERAQPRIRA
jgi:tetratricopeptide (TPR) repeat protein